MTARRSVPALVPAILISLIAGSMALLPLRAWAQAAGDPSLDPNHPDSTRGFPTRIQVTGFHSLVPCEGDSVRVVLSGIFPSDCYRIRRVETQYLRCFAPCAPRILLLVDDGGCLGRPCVQGPIPWKREVVYGPQPAGSYQQTVLTWIGSCLDTFPPTPPRFLSQAFEVRPADSCGLGIRNCLFGDWSVRDRADGCDAVLNAEGHARLGMRLHTRVPLSALQGRLRISDDSLQVTSVVPIGPAAGLTLLWEPTEDGATFVMFSATGAPIPATVAGARPPDILGVGVSVRAGRHAPRVATLRDEGLLGADANGDPVPECPVMIRPLTGAVICAAPTLCDANGDGRTNVGDLVTMLLCLRSACPDSSRFDCDADHRFTIGDVVCCARRLLRAPFGPLGPSRPAGDTRVRFGDPQRTDTGWRLPLTLTGIQEVGAARLALRFPSDRFRIAEVAQQPGAANWLSLFEAEGGELSLGLLNLATGQPEVPWPDRLDVVLDLVLRDGQSPGGSVEFASGDFSARDGAALEVPLPATGLRIPSGISLSPGRPNPFSGATQLVLSMERASEARVTVHDLSGRRIATLLDGRFEAGQRELLWAGRDDSGAAVRDGIYFVRCAGSGQVTAQKVILLRSR